MPLIAYKEKRFNKSSRRLIDQANTIIAAYQAQGFRLTLRQLYYQFVSRDLIANNLREYKRLGNVISEARLAGQIDWNAIEDRTRSVASLSHWSDPTQIVSACSHQFRLDKWEGQEYRPEVWIEKEALAGVVDRACRELDISYLSCRGYTSQSEMWGSAVRLASISGDGQIPVILHFGDHDPSGIDMSRDIQERLAMFGAHVEFRRLALNMNQIDEFDPPPNPAKTTDSRFAAYQRDFGAESWELDALEPKVLVDMIRREVLAMRDQDTWDRMQEREDAHRDEIGLVADNWSTIVERLTEED